MRLYFAAFLPLLFDEYSRPYREASALSRPSFAQAFASSAATAVVTTLPFSPRPFPASVSSLISL